MSSEVKLIEDWRERWEPVGGYKVIAVADTPDGQKAWVVDSYGVLRTYGGVLQAKPRPKTYRPWKREEVPVGSVVRHIRDNTIHMILCYEKNDSVWIAGAGNRPTTYLLYDFVLHRTTESGEWLPVEQCPRCGIEE